MTVQFLLLLVQRRKGKGDAWIGKGDREGEEKGECWGGLRGVRREGKEEGEEGREGGGGS